MAARGRATSLVSPTATPWTGSTYPPPMSDGHMTEIRCAACDADLVPTKDEATCPVCGSGDRNIHASVSEAVAIYESVRGKVRDAGQTGSPSLEFRSGDDLTRSTGEWVMLERRIDRANDRYYERIVDTSGRVIRECDEPLSQHQGRGSAKYKDRGDGDSAPRT